MFQTMTSVGSFPELTFIQRADPAGVQPLAEPSCFKKNQKMPAAVFSSFVVVAILISSDSERSRITFLDSESLIFLSSSASIQLFSSEDLHPSFWHIADLIPKHVSNASQTSPTVHFARALFGLSLFGTRAFSSRFFAMCCAIQILFIRRKSKTQDHLIRERIRRPYESLKMAWI